MHLALPGDERYLNQLLRSVTCACGVSSRKPRERPWGYPRWVRATFRFQAAQAVYKMHFFGREDYRRDLLQSITMHGGFHEHSARVLGEDHPLTREIAQGFLTCFDEQLDWSLDDLPRPYLEYRAKLLGD